MHALEASKLLCAMVKHVSGYCEDGALPYFPEFLTKLKLDRFQKLCDCVSLPDHHLPAVPSAIPIAVGNLEWLILHYLSASQQASQRQLDSRLYKHTTCNIAAGCTVQRQFCLQV